MYTILNLFCMVELLDKNTNQVSFKIEQPTSPKTNVPDQI
jgi:hypothetical protein